MDKLRALQYFVAAAEEGSLSAAGRRLGVTVPAVQKLVNSLEASLGVRLFDRTTRTVRLTAAGEVLYEHGRSIIQEVEAAQGAIDALQHVVTGSVRLSIPTGLGELYLADMLLAFQKRHPQVRIRVLFSNRVSDPMSAQVDVAVRVARDVQEHLVARDLGPVGFGLYASSAYAKARPFHDPAEIPHGVLLTPPGDGKTYAVTEKFGYNTIAYDKSKVDPADMADMAMLTSGKYDGRIGIYDYYLPVLGLVALQFGGQCGLGGGGQAQQFRAGHGRRCGHVDGVRHPVRCPVQLEAVGDARHHGAVDDHVAVEEVVAFRQVEIVVGDVAPADDGFLAVHHQQLAVGAVVRGEEPGQARGVVVTHLHAGRLQRLGVVRRELEDRQREVHQQAHLDAFARLAGQGLRHQPAGGVDLVDEKFQLDGLLGFFNQPHARGQRVEAHVEQGHRVGLVRAHVDGGVGGGFAQPLPFARFLDTQETEVEQHGQAHEDARQAPGQDFRGPPEGPSAPTHAVFPVIV